MEDKKESGIYPIEGGNVEVVFGGRIYPSVLRDKEYLDTVSVRLSELSKLYNVGDEFKHSEYENLNNNTVWLTFNNTKSIDSVIASLSMAKDMLLNVSHRELMEKYPMFQPKPAETSVNCVLKSSDDLFKAISNVRDRSEYTILANVLMQLSMKHPFNKILDGIGENELVDVLTSMIDSDRNALEIIRTQLEAGRLSDWEINWLGNEIELIEGRLEILSKYIDY